MRTDGPGLMRHVKCDNTSFSFLFMSNEYKSISLCDAKFFKLGETE